MQHAPIIKNQHRPRFQLAPNLQLPALEDPREFPRGGVPGVDGVDGHVDGGAVAAVPADLLEEPGLRVVVEDGEAAVGGYADAGVAAGVGVDGDRAEEVVGLGVFVAEEGGGFEAVDEEGGAAGAVGVGEQVEGLEAGGVAEVGVVGVGVEGEGGVGGVFGGEVCREVVEAAVVGLADEGYVF